MSYLCRVTGTMRLLLSILCVFGMLLTPAVQVQEAVQTEQAGCPIIKVAAERLPDLNIPRSGHSVFVANGEVTVVGGHTSGFVLTPTAEYFKDGEWHLLQTVYAHDGGFSVVLKSGKVLLAGACIGNSHRTGQRASADYWQLVCRRRDGMLRWTNIVLTRQNCQATSLSASSFPYFRW